MLTSNDMIYVALLRGVNVGGVIVKMADLKKLMEQVGFTDVKTLLASGNVIFEAGKATSPNGDRPNSPQASFRGDARRIAKKIEEALKAKYKRDIRCIVRPAEDIQMLAKANPFKDSAATKETRLYVTFLDTQPKSHLKSASNFFRVTKTFPFAVCTALVLTPDTSSIDLMASLEKHYGKDITTRNWNTVQKIVTALNT